MKCIALIAFIMIIMIHMLKVGIAIFLLLAAYAARSREWNKYHKHSESDIERSFEITYKR